MLCWADSTALFHIYTHTHSTKQTTTYWYDTEKSYFFISFSTYQTSHWDTRDILLASLQYYIHNADFHNVVAEHRSYAHDASDAMFRRTTSLCLRFALCIVTQWNATFWGVTPRLGPIPLNSNSAKIFVQYTYPQVSSYVYSFGSYRVDTQTHKQTHKQTDATGNIQLSSLHYDIA